MDTSTSETKKKSNTKYKLFKAWSQLQDSEYKSLGKALDKSNRFQSKDRHKVETLKAIVIPWLKKHITDHIGPIPQTATVNYVDIPIETIFTYRAALMNTLNYAIDRLNQKGVYSNVISFCARVLAICFFKIPGVGFALLQALPVSKSHIKRMLNETIGDEDKSIEPIKKQNDETASFFPNHLKTLCYLNIRTWWQQLEDAKKSRGKPPIEMSGNWILLKTYLNIPNSVAFKSITPPLKYLTAPGYIHLATFFLLKIESLIHRNIHTITTVIQFEQPKGNNSNNIPLDAADIGIGSLPATNIRVGSNKNKNNNNSNLDYHSNDGNSNLGNNGNNVTEIGASVINNNNDVISNSGKPKVLETASKRFVETMVAIVENGYFQEMCNVWIKAVVKKTNMYDAESVFCLLDFIDTLIVELDTRDSIIMSIEPSSPGSVSSNDSSNDSNTALFSPPNLTNIIDVSFYISLVQILLKNSDHSITILRTISFIYTHFTLLTSQSNHLKHLVKDTLLNEQIFEQMFCHWSRNIRIYYMRLLVWRVGRMAGSIKKNNKKLLNYINGDGDNDDDFIGENSYVIIDMLITLQNRLENLQTCFEFISNYTGEMKDLQNAIKAKIEENIQGTKNYDKNNQIKSYIYPQISPPIDSNKNPNGNQHKRKISTTTTTIIQWMLKNNQQTTAATIEDQLVTVLYDFDTGSK
nr:12900_t:CDS:10 [Entrophospora candida]